MITDDSGIEGGSLMIPTKKPRETQEWLKALAGGVGLVWVAIPLIVASAALGVWTASLWAGDPVEWEVSDVVLSFLLYLVYLVVPIALLSYGMKENESDDK